MTLYAVRSRYAPEKNAKAFYFVPKETRKGPVWYARFWNETARRYAITRSTGIYVGGKKQHRYEAEQAAWKMLPGIRFAVQSPDKAGKPFIQYAANFWTADSPYVRECALVKKKPLSVGYINLHHDDVRRHIEPFPGFRGITLYALTSGIIRDWMRWAAEKGLAGGRINKVMQAMSVAVRYAVTRGELEQDPFRNIREAPDMRKEKGVLRPVEVAALIHAPVTDHRGGLLLGEVWGLRWGDIGDGVIAVKHNYIDEDGLKAPKCGSTGTVPIPEAAIEEVRRISQNPAPDILVMESLDCPGKPFSKTHLEKALTKELAAIGIPGK